MEDEPQACSEDVEQALLRLTDMPFDELMGSADWALKDAVNRVVRSRENPGDNYAAHGTTP